MKINPKGNLVFGLAVTLITASFSASSAELGVATKPVIQNIDVPNVTLVSNCNNGGSHELSFSTTDNVIFSGTKAFQLIAKARSSKKGSTPIEVGSMSIDVSSLKITDAPLQKGGSVGVGGNPYFYFNWNPPSSDITTDRTPVYLGRCNTASSGSVKESASFTIPKLQTNRGGMMKVKVRGNKCSNNPSDPAGSGVTVQAGLSLGEVKGNLYVGNQRVTLDSTNQTSHVVTDENATVSFSAADADLRLTKLERQSVGGNPEIYVRWGNYVGGGFQADDSSGSSDQFLGRCTDLMSVVIDN